MKRPTVFVCGHGRCGSSMVMQMLDAGGFPCFGDYPAYEPEEVGIMRKPGELLPVIDGMAAKILDPQLTHWGTLPGVRVIWLDRDRNEQGRSQVKFMEIISGMKIAGNAWKTLAASYSQDTRKALLALTASGATVLRLNFEDILTAPYASAVAISQHVKMDGPNLDIKAMVNVVIPRSPKCQRTLDIEMKLIGKARGLLSTK